MPIKLSVKIKYKTLENINTCFNKQPLKYWVLIISTLSAILATAYSYYNDYIIAYGDAESHLNISKRVVDSLTPGFAQLGGIWLPIPHLMLAPFVYFDFFWQSGLAGSIVSGASFIITSYTIYKIALLLTKHKLASLMAAIVFIFNPNILYLQSTPMTELPLMAFFTLSIYFFIKFINNHDDLFSFIVAAFFGFLATLSRYDGWFLVGIEMGIIGLIYLPYKLDLKKLINHKKIALMKSQVDTPLRELWHKFEGRLIFFGTLGFFGVFLWLMWDAIILGDPLFFTHSQFSAKSQQQGWQAKGQLPSYHDLWSSISYYTATAMSNVGVIIFIVAILGFIMLLKDKNLKHRFYILLLLMTPYIFYVVTLFMGQSIIFIPHLTPPEFEWTLFNVRYGTMMVMPAAIFFAYIFYKSKVASKTLLIFLFFLQFALYGVGYSKIISLEDGINGLSTAKRPDAEAWMAENYDDGLIVLDDFSRLMSIIRVGIPMKNVIYIGNKPYWEESLLEPEKHATWIIVQKNDEIWQRIYEPLDMQGRLYKYFTKVYTSPDILIFKRTDSILPN